MLEWSQFAQTVDDPMNFDETKNKWSPYDSRDISGSIYDQITGKSHAPDLRSVFLRGLNSFAPADEPKNLSDDQAGPNESSGWEFPS